MTKTLAVDENNDIFLGADGSLAVASGLVAVMQAAQQSAQTQAREMEYAVDQGLPNFAVTWGGVPNLAQFEAALRRAILGSSPHIKGFQELTITRADNTLRYSAIISTDFGPGALNG